MHAQRNGKDCITPYTGFTVSLNGDNKKYMKEVKRIFIENDRVHYELVDGSVYMSSELLTWVNYHRR